MNTLDTKPWYKQFWPWMLISLPGTVVVAALVTVGIAVKDADDMVVDNYYKDGKTINRVLDQDVKAKELGLSALVSFRPLSGDVAVSVEGKMALPDQLLLKLLHPMEADMDRIITLQSVSAGNYSATLDAKLKHGYDLRLLPTDESPQWRLVGEINFSLGNEAVLAAQ